MRAFQRARLSAAIVVAALAVGAVPGRAPAEAAPPALSSDPARAGIASSRGSGEFGTWDVDDNGMPVYRYEIDEEAVDFAKAPELGGATDAWHQVGNDHIVANVYNHGYTQLWSQDRVYQWVNLYEPAAGHYSGGYGYLNTGTRVLSTMYDDRPSDATTVREFGVGYGRRQMSVPGVSVEELTYAPFGDDAVLLHDVRLTNTSDESLDASWFEYWDVNPYTQVWGRKRGYAAPQWDAASQTLSIQQAPDDDDIDPLTIYAAALAGRVDGFETDSSAFFGNGTRARPAAVVANQTTGSIALPNLPGDDGSAMFAFRSPVTIAPGETAVLRYAYGAARPETIARARASYSTGDPFAVSASAWRSWLPQASFGTDSSEYSWLSRELQWDAYMVRSGTTYEESCGHHILSQGGYYQYGLGLQGGFRDQLGLSLSMISSEPEITREVIRYSAQEQEAATGHVPYAMGHMCTPVALPSADLDFWFFLATSEYALATRDFDFFDERVRYVDATDATLWDHVKLAYRHMEHVVGRGPHGGYLVSASTGDWSDFSAQFMQMTESLFITAQLAYAYPRLAQVADARGDHDFAAQLRATTAELLEILRKEWTENGWFARGYSGATRIGETTIYQEPQPWALLAGAASDEQATTLLANVRRYLTGVGAPDGPSLIGSAQSPAANDPDIGERALPVFQEAGALGSYGGGNAVFLGGVWFALNGPLTWATAKLDGRVDGAVERAWDEYLRNTLTRHAEVFPQHWDGLISVDDMCWAWYAKEASMCGDEVLAPQYRYAGQILNKHAWWLWTLQKLAGIEPDGSGYVIDPHVPFDDFSLRLPSVGVEYGKGRARGYVRTEGDAALQMRVRIPADATGVAVWVDGARAPHDREGDRVMFTLPAAARTAADWAVVWA